MHKLILNTVEDFDKLTNEDKHIIGAIEGNFDEGYINSGQVSGLIADIPSVEELLTSMVDGAKDTLQETLHQFTTN
ncbi:MAG TPA: hypothetical protein VK105_11860 [Virgibacillus sp.]|nr:hypothetical protein [Virgibacillus sp.]HLR67801.1 hypothetical protein [Virgibacillus sp.]